MTKQTQWQLANKKTGNVMTKMYSTRKEALETIHSNQRFNGYRPVKVMPKGKATKGKTFKKATKAKTTAKTFTPIRKEVDYVGYHEDLADFLMSIFEPVKDRKSVGTAFHKNARLGIKN